MARTTANFRALRELCGITQQQVADALGVRIPTVKRWERGIIRVPDDAMEWLMGFVAEHDQGVRENVRAVVEGMGKNDEVCFIYYRTQEQADLDAGPGISGPYQFRNAVARSSAEILVSKGYRVSFTYPDEERIYSGSL